MIYASASEIATRNSVKFHRRFLRDVRFFLESLAQSYARKSVFFFFPYIGYILSLRQILKILFNDDKKGVSAECNNIHCGRSKATIHFEYSFNCHTVQTSFVCDRVVLLHKYPVNIAANAKIANQSNLLSNIDFN